VKYTSFAQQVSEIFLVLVVQGWLQTTCLIQITLGFRKAEDDTKAFVFVL
jgi:hypothetical protein